MAIVKATTKYCSFCGTAFPAIRPYARYCGDKCATSAAVERRSSAGKCGQCGVACRRHSTLCRECYRLALVERGKASGGRLVGSTLGMADCAACGGPFKKKTQDHRYCTRRCTWADPNWRGGNSKEIAKRQAWLESRRCRNCDCHIPTDRKGLFCSDSCQQRALDERQIRGRDKARAVRATSPANTTLLVCSICNGDFTKPLLVPGVHKFCSPRCRKEAERVARAKFRSRSGRKMIDRARSAGVPYERGVGPISVCTRDTWTCQLCGVKTPRSLRGTYHDRAPEVDHIIPLSVSGSPGHVWSNVQCACRRCNLAKSNRPMGQMRLSLLKSA